MRHQDATNYLNHPELSMLAGWTAPQPQHHALEADAAELTDLQERDTAARTVFVRRTIRAVTAVLLAISVYSAAPARADQCGVSAEMASRIVMYQAVTANLDGIDPRTAPDAWTMAASAWERAQADLLDQRPAGIADFTAKMDALVGDADDEAVALNQLSADARGLAEGCAK